MKKDNNKSSDKKKALSGMGMDISNLRTAKSKGFVKSEKEEGGKKENKKPKQKTSLDKNEENNKFPLDGVPEFMVEDLKDIVVSPSGNTVRIEKDTHELLKRMKVLTGVPIRHIITASLLYYVRNHQKELELLSKKDSPRWKL